MEKNLKLDPMLNWTLYHQMPEDQINHFIFDSNKLKSLAVTFKTFNCNKYEVHIVRKAVVSIQGVSQNYLHRNVIVNILLYTPCMDVDVRSMGCRPATKWLDGPCRKTHY